MKTWHLFIGIVVILALICSPVLAISKADLISQYKGQSAPTIPTSAPPGFQPSQFIITAPVGSLSVSSDPPGVNVFLDGHYQGITPIVINGLEATYSTCDECVIKGHPVEGTHEIKLTKEWYQNYIDFVTLAAGKTTSISVKLTPVSLTKSLPITPITAPTQVPKVVVTIDPHMPFNCVPCDDLNWSPACETGYVPSPTPTPAPKDALNDYTDDLPRECGGSIKRSVEELIASYIHQQSGTWYEEYAGGRPVSQSRFNF